MLGKCLECPFGKYPELDLYGATSCKDCPGRCAGCIHPGNCTLCSNGNHWGTSCESDCTGCEGSCDVSSGCVRGCRHGHYQISINGGFLCLECSDTCKNLTCSSTNGTCTYGCENDWSGLKCDTKCSTPCLTCDQNNPAMCMICKDGSQGPICKTSSASVPMVSTLLAFSVFVYNLINYAQV